MRRARRSPSEYPGALGAHDNACTGLSFRQAHHQDEALHRCARGRFERRPELTGWRAAVLVLVAVVMAGDLAPRERGQSTGRGSFAISSGDRLKVSTSISATNTAPTATVASAAPPTMRAATMPTMFTGSDPRSRLVLPQIWVCDSSASPSR